MGRKYRRRKSAGASILRDTSSIAASGAPLKVFLFGVVGFLGLYFGFPLFLEGVIASNGEKGLMGGVATIIERRIIWSERLGIAVFLLCTGFALFRRFSDRKIGKQSQKISVVVAKAASRSIEKNT
ncbi:hypothetical protein [Microbulbifer hydrolyticus]|uniref:Uncharacterized protein n=1 Tax=Microbulbifer hydrolyticus TaxID=48074 RepID=A0A6P1T726_9GAMM|nr:hypothetical protein [Microbulbifer hydrolyticus]MBB5213324.1 hypothetical protein [Microbulbifer hydrolyticus]QHQ38614.1 hypothetical protein GTQ55_06170 [Microbulbifer hydrolyticus]